MSVSYLLSIDNDPKTSKSNKLSDEWLTAIQYLAPAMSSGYQVCAHASAGCVAGCLNTAGIPFFLQSKLRARIERTRLFFEKRDEYLERLSNEIERAQRRAYSMGRKLAVRLNGTSDIVWERVAPQLFTRFHEVQFYDYSKIPKRFAPDWVLPRNYDLTFSRSETNDSAVLRVLDAGGRAAVVFSPSRFKSLPDYWLGREVVDGDTHDMTFTRPRGVLGLRAKGKARKDTSGFVIQWDGGVLCGGE